MLTKIEFTSGVIKDDTPLASEGGWIDANNVRFRQGKPETHGGYEIATTDQFTGIGRGGHAWSDLTGEKQLAFGTANKLQAYTGGLLIDITPRYSEGVLTNPFTTTNGSSSVSVTIAEHGLSVGQTINFQNADAVGGLTINGAYQVVAVSTRNTFTITASGSASSGATGGGAVDYYATMVDGLVDGTGGRGFGTGTYGTGTYGLPSDGDFRPSVWSLDSLGEILIACRRGGPLFAWQPQASYANIALTGDFSADQNWAKGTGWTISGGKANKSAGTGSILSQNIQGIAKPGYTYRITGDVTRSAGTLKIRVNAGAVPAAIDVGDASTAMAKNMSFSRLFVMPADPVDICFEADASFVGTLDNVTIKLESTAFMVKEAPRRIESIFVDPHGVVVAVGTFELDGDFNPNCVRNCGLGNFRLWVPDTDNVASEIILRGGGGRLLRGLATRQQDLVFGDDGLFRLQWQGEAGQAFTSDLLGTGCGLIGQNAAAEHNGIAFWLSANGNFYIFQGAIPQVITSCRLRRDVFENIATSQEEKIYCGINAEFSEVRWFYPDARDGNECSRYADFNWLEDHWSCGMAARSTWLRAGIYGYPIALGTDGYIYFHERGESANGGALESFLESGDFDIGDGALLSQVLDALPDFENQLGNVTLTFSSKMAPNTGIRKTVTKVSTPTTRHLPFRLVGRSLRIRLTSSAMQSFWRMGTLRVDVEPAGGARR